MARSIIGVGVKVEVSFEEDDLRDAWFPATVIEDLGNNIFLIEYQCSGINDEAEVRKVTVDHRHIRPSTPPIRDTNFVLLEKVDAFYDFGWWTGVITKKLADSRYIVYFKHTNKEREVSHLELRLHVEHGESSSVKRSTEERATVLLNFRGPIEGTTPGIEKQTSIVASTMKRTKVVTSAGSNLKPCNKLKPGITFDDQTLSDAGQSGKTSDKTENLSRGKRMLVKREKNIELSSPVITSARKKGRSPADSRVVKGDSINIKTISPMIVEKVHKELPPPITCVMGLQCKVVTMSQTKNVKIVEPLTPKTTPDEGKEATLKRKRGRPFKSQPETPLAVTHDYENGDALKKTPVEKVANTTSVQLEKYQSVKGKRGKRRKISSINIVSPAQKPKESSEAGVETILDDDEPLSRWFEGKQQQQQIENVGNGEKLSFEKRSSTLWATLEAMEAFQMIPQKPHFRPLEKEKECTREGQAISKMVNYLRVVEAATSQAQQLLNPRSVFEDSLEALADLESHGFDVKAVRERLSGLLRIKEKQEGLEEESKKVKQKMEVERVEGVRIDKEIELLDKQVVALLEKRAQVLNKKEKQEKQVGALEAQVEAIHQGISEARRNFHGLAAASLCVSQAPP